MKEFYIDNFDVFSEVLVIRPNTSSYYLAAREDVKSAGINEGFGYFVKEGEHLIGIFATSSGPILFFDKTFLSAKIGITVAVTEIDDKSGLHRFCITENEKPVFSLFYRDKHGVDTNPYDKERVDVDFFSMLSEGLKNPQFFINYSQDT